MEIETPNVEYAFTVVAKVDRPQSIGPSYAGARHFYPITGGTVEGFDINGVVIPGGGDWQTVRTDGVVVLDAHYALRTNDGVIIQVHNRGLLQMARDAATPNRPDTGLLRTTAQFIAPNGRYDWLNRYVFLGTVSIPDETIDHVRVNFFKVV